MPCTVRVLVGTENVILFDGLYDGQVRGLVISCFSRDDVREERDTEENKGNIES
jgi:hypothetical protein